MTAQRDLVVEARLRLEVTQLPEPLVRPFCEGDLAEPRVQPVASDLVRLHRRGEPRGVRLADEVARPLATVRVPVANLVRPRLAGADRRHEPKATSPLGSAGRPSAEQRALQSE